MEEWMKHLLLLVLMLSFLYFPVGPGYADETENKETASVDEAETIESGTETEAEQSKIYMKIGEITVTEKAYLPTADIPASVDVVGKDQVEMENVDTSNELMKKIPGIYFGDWNQGVVSSTFTLRGYDVNTAPPVALIIVNIRLLTPTLIFVAKF